MFGRSWVLVACAWVSGCGGAPPAARAPEPKAAASAPSPPPAPRNSPPPAALAERWVPATTSSTFSARLSLGKLAREPFFQAMLPTLTPSLPQRFAPCLSALVAHADELLLRGAEGRTYAVASFDAGGLDAARLSCLGAVVPTSSPVTLAGAAEAYEQDGGVLALVPPQLLLFGPKAEVQAALTPGHATEPLPTHFTLESDQLLALRVDVPEPAIGVDASLSSSAERLLVSARARLPAEELAERIQQGFGVFRAQAKERVQEAGGDASVQALLDSVTLQRTGRQLDATLTLGGSVEQRAHAVGQLAAISVVSTQRYLLRAKAAEAKAVLAAIVKAYQRALREAGEAAPKMARKLASFPAVPRAVPRGEEYQSTPEDWKSWAPLHFTLSAPQRFQYEIVAAKDGRSAEVIARGDLDGDGELSEQRLKIELDPKTSQLSAKGVVEVKPLE